MKQKFALLLTGLLLLSSCAPTQTSDNTLTGLPAEQSTEPIEQLSGSEPSEQPSIERDTVMMKHRNDFAEPYLIDSIEGKGLEPYGTVEKTAEVFFETGSKIRSAILAAEGMLYMGNEGC